MGNLDFSFTLLKMVYCLLAMSLNLIRLSKEQRRRGDSSKDSGALRCYFSNFVESHCDISLSA